MSVIWTDAAAAQLLAIRDYLAQSSPGYAQVLVNRIVTHADRLASQPFIGSQVPEYDDEAIREVFEYSFRILYRVDGQDVQVLAVIHSSRRLPRTPPS